MVESKYTAIFAVRDLLEECNIPYQFLDHGYVDNRIYEDGSRVSEFMEGYQIVYASFRDPILAVSVIQTDTSDGHEDDLLEILIQDNENTTGRGYLTVEEVFELIQDMNRGTYDDITAHVDLNIVTWLKSEMRREVEAKVTKFYQNQNVESGADDGLADNIYVDNKCNCGGSGSCGRCHCDSELSSGGKDEGVPSTDVKSDE